MSNEREDQFAELQSQIAFQEDSIQKLSEALYNQQRRMDEMERQIEFLKNELDKTRVHSSGVVEGSEIPPHY